MLKKLINKVFGSKYIVLAHQAVNDGNKNSYVFRVGYRRNKNIPIFTIIAKCALHYGRVQAGYDMEGVEISSELLYAINKYLDEYEDAKLARHKTNLCSLIAEKNRLLLEQCKDDKWEQL